MKDIGKKTKKILHILEPEPDGQIGGADMHVLDLLIEQKKHSCFENYIFINQNYKYKEFLEESKLSYIFIDKSLGYFNILKKLSTWIDENNINIIHSHGYDANYLTFLIRLLLKNKHNISIIMTCHGWIKVTLILKLKTYLDIFTYRIANILIATSQPIQSSLKKIYSSKRIEYIPNSVSIRKVTEAVNVRQMFRLGESSRLIAYIGRLSPEKRIDIFLKACKEINKVQNDTFFLIVGSGPEENKLKSLSVSLDLEQNVIFTGVILDNNLLSNIYQNIEFLILTSDTETTPRVILEAMSSSRPIIATDVGGVNELVKHNYNGFLVEKGDYFGIANHALTLLNNSEMKLTFGAKSYQLYQEKFTMPIEAQSVNNLYQLNSH